MRCLALMLGLSLVCVGCQGTRRPDGYAVKARPVPRPEPRRTALVRISDPTRVAVIVSSTTRDTDGDGFGDHVDVSALLFGDHGPDPVYSTGEFAFELVRLDPDDHSRETIGTWIFGPEAVRKAEGPTMFGLPGYKFQLDLGEAARGMQPAAANLLTGFRSGAGGPFIVPAEDRRMVRVGPVG